MRILILGGTTEAAALVQALAEAGRHTVTLSLAGRTRTHAESAAPVRSGGFGGATGLAAWMREHGTELLVDATHPFAARMSGHAVMAAGSTGTPLLSLLRPPWTAVEGDRWTEVPTTEEIAPGLVGRPRRVFLTTGSTDAVAIMAAAPHHSYLVRSIEPVAIPEAIMADVIIARGPFTQAAENALMLRKRVELLVSKNAGGDATYGKIAAARALNLPVLMVRRPDKLKGAPVSSVREAVQWIDDHATALTKRGV